MVFGVARVTYHLFCLNKDQMGIYPALAVLTMKWREAVEAVTVCTARVLQVGDLDVL